HVRVSADRRALLCLRGDDNADEECECEYEQTFHDAASITTMVAKITNRQTGFVPNLSAVRHFTGRAHAASRPRLACREIVSARALTLPARVGADSRRHPLRGSN